MHAEIPGTPSNGYHDPAESHKMIPKMINPLNPIANRR